jgi:hypothetical protein
MRMKFAVSIAGFFLLIFLQILCPEVYSQTVPQKASRQSAIDAFSKDNFEQAYSQFSELSASYPKDILYKYYCGVCLVKLNRDPLRSSSLLQSAIKGSTAIRSLPPDCFFYLGRAQQMSGKYNEAIKSYNSYSEQVSKKTSRESGIPQFLQQCNEKKGAIAVVSEQKPDLTKKENAVTTAIIAAPIVEKTATKLDDTIPRQIETVSQNYDVLVSQALDYQFKADSLSQLAAGNYKRIETASSMEKANLKVSAQNLEKLAASNQILADQKLAEAHKISLKPENIRPDTGKVKTLTGQNQLKADSIITHLAVAGREMITDSVKSINDSVKTAQAKKPEKIVAIEAESKITVAPVVISIFEIKEKPVYPRDEKVTVNPAVPSGLIYRIQVAVFRNPVAPTYFKGITPVFGFRNEGAEITNYYAGLFRKSVDATKALTRVKAIGFKDAFIVALFDKKVISADRAAILEKEWETKSLIITSQKITDAQRDTIPPTLVFRIEVNRSVKPLPTDQLENIKKLAGSRGLDIIVNETKQNIYLIGVFLTFESASEYSDLLVRNGLKEAKVVAYLGKKEIPVETAKQLFEKQ